MSLPMKRRVTLVASITIICAAFAAGAGFTPAVSANAVNPSVTSVTCNDKLPCTTVLNIGRGQAIFGQAMHTFAVVGQSQVGKPCPHPTGWHLRSCNPIVLDIVSAVRGNDVSTPPPHFPSYPGNFAAGVIGNSQSGFGVVGIGLLRGGVLGITYNQSSITGNGRIGMGGIDASTDGGTANVGVKGYGYLSEGVEGDTFSGIGTGGITDNPSASSGFSSFGVVGSDASFDGGVLNIGVLGMSNGTGVSAVGFAPAAPAGQLQTPALGVTCANGGPAIIANTGQPNGDIMSLDCGGNMILLGGITTDSTPLIETKTIGGQKVVAFVPRQAQQTIEDVGEAQLVNGQAFVNIDAAFASTIKQRSSYLVFITPEGLTQGTLCVTQRTGAGFAVRENQGGRSSVAFAYRIVAQPLDASSQRLPLVEDALRHQRPIGGHARVTPAQMLERLTHGHIHMPVRHDLANMF